MDKIKCTKNWKQSVSSHFGVKGLLELLDYTTSKPGETPQPGEWLKDEKAKTIAEFCKVISYFFLIYNMKIS